MKRALERALFDGQVRRDFRALRQEGKKVREVEEILAARYGCSAETIRTIWYRKRERQTRGHRRR